MGTPMPRQHIETFIDSDQDRADEQQLRESQDRNGPPEETALVER